MIRSYLPIVIFLGIALLFLAGSFFASTLLAPKRRTMAKTASYECGIIPENDEQQRFGVKFYILAIAFIIVDVEIIFLYPFSTVFIKREVNGVEIAGLGSAGLAVMGIFLLILLVPFAYLLASGALNFGPLTAKVSSLLTPITRSQGFTASAASTSLIERRTENSSSLIQEPSMQKNVELSGDEVSASGALTSPAQAGEVTYAAGDSTPAQDSDKEGN